MKFLAIIFAALVPLTVSAQQQPSPSNPNTFGRWEFEAENGMHGSVIIDDGFCHYTVSSSFMSMQSRCVALWKPNTNTLLIVPPLNPQGGAFTVPEYQDQRGPEIASGRGDGSLSFHMTRFGVEWMSGHLVGAGEHVSVRLQRH